MLRASPEVEQLAYRVIGAAIEVHRHLGPGLLESAYESAMSIELALRDIPFERQREIIVHYKGHAISTTRIDMLIGNQLVIELKAVESISQRHTAQALGYLVSGGFELALIINFNVAVMREGIRRVIFTPDPSDPFAPSCLRGRSS